MIPAGVIVLRPALPPVLTVLLILLFAVAAWLTGRRCGAGRRRQAIIWALRITAVLILTGLLMQPERRTATIREEPSLLVLALDVSASMDDRIPGVDLSRADRAREFLAAGQFKRFAAPFRVVRFDLGPETHERIEAAGDIEFKAPRSNLASGLNEIARRLQAERPAAVIVLSDGLDHSGADLSAEAQALPVYALELEPPSVARRESPPDVRIDEVVHPETAILDWDATVEVIIRRSRSGPESFPVHLYEEGRRLQSVTATFAAGQSFQRLSFVIHPERRGRLYYYVEIVPEDDHEPQNNIREFMIDVVAPENRIVYLEGVPRWEFKFLKRVLLAEKTFELAAFVRGADGAFVSFGEGRGFLPAALPNLLSPDELARCKVLILGDLEVGALERSEQEALAGFVERGGGLLILGAAKAYGSGGWKSSDILRPLLPAVPEPGSVMAEGRFAVECTAAGRSHPALRNVATDLAELPPILSIWRPARVGEFSSVLLAAADGSPVAVVRRYGQGRVAMVLSDSLWRLQLGEASTVDARSFYSRFVTQLVHWLAPSRSDRSQGEMLQVVTAGSEFELQERLRIGALYSRRLPPGQVLTCTVTTPDDRRLAFPMRPAELGQDVGLSPVRDGYDCEFVPQVPGRYEVTVADPEGAVTATQQLLVKRADRELTGQPADRAFLRKIAGATGGELIPWEQRFSFQTSIQNEPVRMEILREYPVWNRAPLYFLLVVLLIGEWWYRRRLDLV
jgi:hypothetical protein